MAKKNDGQRKPKPPVIKFSDGVASGQFTVVTEKEEVVKLLGLQRGGKGSSSGSIDTQYTIV